MGTSGACGDHVGMSREAYSAHIKQLATDIKDKVAEKAARQVFDTAQDYQAWVSKYVDDEERIKAHNENRGPSLPAPIPADKGYAKLPPMMKETVDEYRAKYRVDLLSFDARNMDEAENQLKNTHLTWIVDKFTRGANLPDPKKSDPDKAGVYQNFDNIAGRDGFIDIKTKTTSRDDPNARESGIDIDITITQNVSESLLGKAVGTDIPSIQDTVKPWEAGTADVFRTRFLPGIPRAGANQIQVAKAMRNLLVANSALLAWGRKDIDSIVHDGKKTVESFGKSSNGNADLATWLGIAAGVTAMIAGIATWWTGAGVAVAIAGAGTFASGATTLGQNLQNVKTEEFKLGADDLDGVVDNIMKAVDHTYGQLDKAWAELGPNGMTKLDGKMKDNPNLFRAPEPGAGANGVKFGDATQANVKETVEK